MPVPLATRARQSRDTPSVDCVYPLALDRQLESIGGRPQLLASERQWDKVLILCAHGLQERSGIVPCLHSCCFQAGNRKMLQPLVLANPSRGGGECHNHPCSLTFAREQENARTICTGLPQPGSRAVLQPPALSPASARQ